MKIIKKKHLGASLIEVMLVLVIGASLIIMSIQEYLSYRQNADVMEVRSNVDMLFQAMSDYYYINCYGTTNNIGQLRSLTRPSGTLGFVSPINLGNGTLDPFMSSSLPSLSPLLDEAASVGAQGESGYAAQFNLSWVPVQTCVAGTVAAGCTSTMQTGTNALVTIQISVALKDATTASQFSQLLQAECLSTPAHGGVALCSENSPGTFAVFERTPSNASPQTVSQYWPTMPVVKEFTNMYRNESINYSLSKDHTTEFQNFYCGT